ncbi:hypothetical protein J5751_00510 [bacterium]|nr:hypothetical protein [bacterium]
MNSVSNFDLFSSYNFSTSFNFFALSFASSFSDLYKFSSSPNFSCNVFSNSSINCFFCSSVTFVGIAYFTNVKILSISFEDNCNN